MTGSENGKWDAFISHASEDKDDFVRPLAKGLRDRGLTVWFDEFELKVGDSLRSSIDRGLRQSRFGIVVLSPQFFEKQWPKNELSGLVTREVNGAKVILPVWHKIDADGVRKASPILADRYATSSSKGLETVIEDLMQAIAPRPLTARSRTAHAMHPGTPQGLGTSSRLGSDQARSNAPRGSLGKTDEARREIADRIREEVESLAKPGEKWNVAHNPRISVTLYNPNNPSQGRGFEINASNYDDLDSVMESLRSEWEALGHEEEEYERALLDRFKSEATGSTRQEIACRIREEVDSLAKAGEKWTVTDNPRISLTLHNPKNPSQGRGFEINASNYDNLASVMQSLRAEWEARGQQDDEYENALLERFRSER